jgi:uncharacterized protein YecT (DUF1311 family)
MTDGNGSRTKASDVRYGPATGLNGPVKAHAGASRRSVRSVVACIFLTGTAVAAQATRQLLSQRYEEPTPDARAFDTEDARLNDIYKALAAPLDDDKRKALRDEGRQWMRGRDKQCAKQAYACKRLLTTTRADELQLCIGGLAAMAGEWEYATDCDFGHFTEWVIPNPDNRPIAGLSPAFGRTSPGIAGHREASAASGATAACMCASVRMASGAEVTRSVLSTATMRTTW